MISQQLHSVIFGQGGGFFEHSEKAGLGANFFLHGGIGLGNWQFGGTLALGQQGNVISVQSVS
mgnify:CR=1 FL=1